MLTFRPTVRSTPRLGLRGALALQAHRLRGLVVLASLLLLNLGFAQSDVDGAIQNFQAEGTRLIGVVSAAGLAVIGAGVLMTLGWAMLRKISGGK